MLRWVQRAVALVVTTVLKLPLALFHAMFDRLAAAYDRQLAWVLPHPVLTVFVSFVLLGGSLTLMAQFPNGSTKVIQLDDEQEVS